MCADDAAARDRGQRLDEAQDVGLGEAREHPEVEQRRAKPAAREGESDLAAIARERGLRVVAEEGTQRLPGRRPGVRRCALARHPDLLEPRQAHQLLEGALLLPLRADVLTRVREPALGLDVVARAEVQLGPGGGFPVAPARRRLRAPVRAQVGEDLATQLGGLLRIRRGDDGSGAAPTRDRAGAGSEEVEGVGGIGPGIRPTLEVRLVQGATEPAGAVEGQRLLQVVELAREIELALVDRAPQRQRLGIAGPGIAQADLVEQRERIPEPRARQQLLVAVRALRELLHEPARLLGREALARAGRIGIVLPERQGEHLPRPAELQLGLERRDQILQGPELRHRSSPLQDIQGRLHGGRESVVPHPLLSLVRPGARRAGGGGR